MLRNFYFFEEINVTDDKNIIERFIKHRVDFNYVDIVKLLLDYNVDVDHINKNGYKSYFCTDILTMFLNNDNEIY